MPIHIASGRVWVQGKVYSPVLVNGSRTREKWDKVQGRYSRECKIIKMINYMFWAEQVGVYPPQGESPKCYSWLDMNPDDVSS